MSLSDLAPGIGCRDPLPAIRSGSLGGVRHYYRRVRIPGRSPGVVGRFHWGGRSEVYQLLRVWHVGQGSQICSPSTPHVEMRRVASIVSSFGSIFLKYRRCRS